MIDALRLPVLGAVARWRHARLLLQVPMLLAAVLVVAHGLLGPDIAPRNLATVLTWVHYRGLLVVALLAVGNLFCAACPMMLVRDAGRKLRSPRRRWPRALRNKWPAIVLFALVLFIYELYDLWSLPRATAWLILAYFGAALLVDLVFAGASFCKYVCPVGQFNFLGAMLSPAELRVREAHVCRSCRTVDCIKGTRAAAAPGLPVVTTQRGCELGLFMPGKVGNLDCTLCLDCVHACPHDNIAFVPRVPGEEIAVRRRRAGIGRLARRPDLAALAALFTFGALINAYAMTGPAARMQHRVSTLTGIGSETGSLVLMFVGALVVLPLTLLGAATLLSRLLGIDSAERSVASRYVFALVPLAMAIWTAHYGFHLLTGAFTAIPVSQSAAIDLFGAPLVGEPQWSLTGLRPGQVYPLQIGLLVLGTLGSLALVYRISSKTWPRHPGRAALPWAAVVVLLAAAAGWVLSLPMEMRGVGPLG